MKTILLLSFIAITAAPRGAHLPVARVEASAAAPAGSAIPAAAPAGTQLQAPDGSQTTLDDVLHRYAGKVIYLDVWASWCGPCRHQAPFLESLRTAFAKDSVVFLSISIDADPADWKQAMSELGATGSGTDFLLIDGHHSSLNNILHIKGVPRYALLDRSGHFVDKDAPFPSTDEAADHIKTLLQSR
ncbi:MAG TPA: TlpA disulfide reductase family protein [Dinghuibacter sp.]|jgi:thiol-disulfide isomerase/thioredoxin|uniref:TlpA family protein disulfide reductase n=1 Tax=Dinghuibacter sp. TaxID=2024697 RepID=UPI002C59D12D|nr:TlpA disulfide reductase family protein [Dinghuibacter sp.]HTJ14707.1 TlpA disulfide reductase family protein [Dinghuibacter sp.]